LPHSLDHDKCIIFKGWIPKVKAKLSCWVRKGIFLTWLDDEFNDLTLSPLKVEGEFKCVDSISNQKLWTRFKWV
jgi:hypothetical protein